LYNVVVGVYIRTRYTSH